MYVCMYVCLYVCMDEKMKIIVLMRSRRSHNKENKSREAAPLFSAPARVLTKPLCLMRLFSGPQKSCRAWI